MLTYSKDDFDESLEDILVSVNKILNKTGEGYETVDNEENKDKKTSLKENKENKKDKDLNDKIVV